jgi:hypothetical protein
MPHPTDQLKRRLRQLKRLERRLRFGHRPPPSNGRLVWDTFFSTRETAVPPVKYPLAALLALSPAELQDVIAEYFYHVVYQAYRENGLAGPGFGVYDPQALALLGLPAEAGPDDVKRRFRELARRHHPDMGGDSEKFITLMSAYDRLRGRLG